MGGSSPRRPLHRLSRGRSPRPQWPQSPRRPRLIVIMKIAGVFLVAIGLEGMVIALQAAGPNSVRDGFILMAVFIPLGVFVSMFPIRIRTGACVACMSPLERDQAICPKCGAPQM